MPNSGLVDHRGRPISSTMKQGQRFADGPENKKAAPPALGPSFGAWAGRDSQYVTLPGGGIVQFDLSQLRVEDFRTMRDHYQINVSLNVLSFMQHQSDWKIVCEDKKIADAAHQQMEAIWTMLNAGLSTSNWAGYSPNALEWKNEGRMIEVDKVKDLVPEECEVRWEKVEGWAPPGKVPPKFNVYGGIKQVGSPYPIPVENSFWYPILMENGDYSGRKLLRPAFQSWFFSILLHLFANRYYERFGEPVPIGRAPFDDTIDTEGKTVKGNQYMLSVLQQLRNRSVVVLPNDRTQFGSEPNPDFDYDIEYLESQMRGADFERYMTRLDEEMSIALFTPILLLRTADVGSYNLGTQHFQSYLMMLNALNADRAEYINKYILSKWTDYNFGPNAPRPKIKYRKLGATDSQTIREVLTAMLQQGRAKVDVEELGQLVGMTVEEINETRKVTDPSAPGEDDEDTGDDTGEQDTPDTGGDAIVLRPARASADAAGDVRTAIVARVRGQVETAFKAGNFAPGLRINMGYKKRMGAVLDSTDAADILYAKMDNWLASVLEFANDFDTADEFVTLFDATITREIANCAV